MEHAGVGEVIQQVQVKGCVKSKGSGNVGQAQRDRLQHGQRVLGTFRRVRPVAVGSARVEWDCTALDAARLRGHSVHLEHSAAS